MLGMARQYGDIVHMKVGNRRDYLLNHPDYIRDVLLAPETMLRSTARSLQHLLGQGLLSTVGDVHRRDRRALQPSFLRTHGEEWAALVVDFTLRLRSRMKTGQTIDVGAEMLRIAQGVIIRLLMAVDTDTDGGALRALLTVITDRTNQATFPSLLKMLLSGPHRGERRLNDAIAVLDRMIYALIAERRAGGCDGSDLLSTMVRMRDGAGEPVMSDSLMRDQILTHLTAGHETVGNALTWTWFLLARHPDVEAEMHAELESVLSGRTPTLDDLKRLTFTEAVLNESMRLYPPVWVFTRRPVDDFELGGYRVPARSYLQICPYVIHRNARYFPNPDEFEPRRWLNGALADRNPFAYVPFGSGAHRCIGEALASIQAMLVLATLGQEVRLRLHRGSSVRPEGMITIRPAGAVPMAVEIRH
jgi:cytochrome P450